MTLYALFVCSQLLGRCEPAGRVIPVPHVGVHLNAFATLALCRKYSALYFGRQPDAHGRWHLRPGGYWTCFERHVSLWHEAR